MHYSPIPCQVRHRPHPTHSAWDGSSKEAAPDRPHPQEHAASRRPDLIGINNRALELTTSTLAGLAHNLHADRGSRILVGGGRHRAVLDASGRVPTQHGVRAPHRHREPHLGALASLRLVDSARRAAALAEKARLSVGWHWAALAYNAKRTRIVGAVARHFLTGQTARKPHYCVQSPIACAGVRLLNGLCDLRRAAHLWRTTDARCFARPRSVSVRSLAPLPPPPAAYPNAGRSFSKGDSNSLEYNL